MSLSFSSGQKGLIQEVSTYFPKAWNQKLPRAVPLSKTLLNASQVSFETNICFQRSFFQHVVARDTNDKAHLPYSREHLMVHSVNAYHQ